jgi:hypothetical protein
MPSAVEHGIERAGELARAVPDQELESDRALSEAHQEVASCLRCPHAVRAGGDADQVNSAGAMLDHDQGGEAPQEHGVHVDEVGGDDAASLSYQELPPSGSPADNGRAGRRPK